MVNDDLLLLFNAQDGEGRTGSPRPFSFRVLCLDYFRPARLGLISSKALDILMGRSFESVRQGVKDVSARWLKASRALKKEDQIYGQRLAEMAKKHSSESFYALDDPLEAAVFSVLVEMLKVRSVDAEMDRIEKKGEACERI